MADGPPRVRSPIRSRDAERAFRPCERGRRRVSQSFAGEKVPEPRISFDGLRPSLPRPGAGGSRAAMRSPGFRSGSPASLPQRPVCDFLPLPDHSAPGRAGAPVRAFLARQETLARPSSALLRACACGPAVVTLATAISAVLKLQSRRSSWLKSAASPAAKTLAQRHRTIRIPEDSLVELASTPRREQPRRGFCCRSKPTPPAAAEGTDPSFPTPIFANLVEIDGGYALVWSG